EPDGALLQFQPRAQYPWPQTLHGAHCKRTFVASARSNSPSTPRSRRAEPILELIPVSVRPLPPHPVLYVIDGGSCPASSGKSQPCSRASRLDRRGVTADRHET